MFGLTFDRIMIETTHLPSERGKKFMKRRNPSIVHFTQKDYMLVHPAQVHDGKKPFSCAFSNAMFGGSYLKNNRIK